MLTAIIHVEWIMWRWNAKNKGFKGKSKFVGSIKHNIYDSSLDYHYPDDTIAFAFLITAWFIHGLLINTTSCHIPNIVSALPHKNNTCYYKWWYHCMHYIIQYCFEYTFPNHLTISQFKSKVQCKIQICKFLPYSLHVWYHIDEYQHQYYKFLITL